MDFRDVSVTELAAKVRACEVSSRELVQAAFARIESLDDALNAFVATDEERALHAAADLDERAAAGEDVGPLAGIPLAVKDLEDAEGLVTTHGSVLHRDDAPATTDSVLVSRLRAAGCIVIGKTNTPEYGWKGDTSNALFGSTRNPWSLERSPGGSSGGSAAALAGGLVPLATGSDGGGSIRIPSAVCGLSGMKPSVGRVPTGTKSPDWTDLSVQGPMARRIADVAAALDAVVGEHPADFRSLPAPDEPWAETVERAAAGDWQPARVAWSPDLGYGRVDAEVATACRAAVDALADRGVEVVEAPAIFDEDPMLSWFTMACAYNLRSLEAYRGSPQWADVDPLLASFVDYAADNYDVVELVKSVDRCHALAARLGEVLVGVDALLCPVVAGQTPSAGEMSGTIDGVEEVGWVAFTYTFNMTRSPAGTVPVGFCADGMPVGLQVVGRRYDDLGVLRTLAAVEATMGLDPKAPFGPG